MLQVVAGLLSEFFPLAGPLNASSTPGEHTNKSCNSKMRNRGKAERLVQEDIPTSGEREKEMVSRLDRMDKRYRIILRGTDKERESNGERNR